MLLTMILITALESAVGAAVSAGLPRALLCVALDTCHLNMVLSRAPDVFNISQGSTFGRVINQVLVINISRTRHAEAGVWADNLV